MNSDTRDGARAVALAAIMVLSVVAMGVAFTGSAAADSHVITVDDDAESDYDTIQDAIDTEGKNTVIEVENGSYDTFTIQTNSVTVRAAEGASPTVSGATTDIGASPSTIGIDASQITISGLSIDAGERGFYIASGASDLSINNNSIQVASGDNTYGILSEADISGLSIRNNAFTTPDGPAYTHLYVNGETAGSASEDVTVSDNQFGGTVGFAVGVDSDPARVVNNDFSSVTISQSREVAVEIFSDPDPELSGNTGNLVDIASAQGNSDTHQLYSSIDAAVNSASDGDTVTVSAGTYTESVGIGKNITLRGAGAENTKISPKSGSAVSTLGNTEGELDGITVEGFTLDGPFVALSGTEDAAPTTLNLTLRDVQIDGSNIVFNAVENASVDNVEVSNYSATNGAGALELTGVSHLTVSDSTFLDNSRAIRLQSTEGLPETAYGDNGQITISNSNFEGNDEAVINGDEDVVIDATNNWWGSANGPSAGSENTYNDGDQGAEISDNVEFTPWLNASTDNDGQSFAPVVNSDTDEQFASIQEALEEASNGDFIYAEGGSYDEYLRFNANNVTLYSDEGATVAPTEDTMEDETRGRIVDIDGANEIRITGISVEGIGTSTSDPTGITLNGENASVHNATVENVLTGIQTSSGGSDGARIHDVTVRNVGVGVSIQSNDAILDSSTIESARIEGVGITDGREDVYLGNNDFADVSGPLVKLYDNNDGTESTVHVSYNNLSAGESAIVNEDSGHVQALFNWFGSENGPEDGDIEGSVTYDPFLTAPTDEVDHPTEEDGVLTRQFGSDLTLDEGVNAFAFPAPSERSLNETVNMSNVQVVYAYDNTEDTWTQVSDDPTPGALDVFVVVVEDGKAAEAVMEFENDRSEQTVPDSTEVSGGWNLVSPTQAGSTVDEAFATQNADIQTTLSNSPYQSAGSQPRGASFEAFSPYNAYWTFIDDDAGDSTIAATTYDGITAEEFFVNVDLLDLEENGDN